MDNVIGIGFTPEERQGKWDSMLLLREVIKYDKDKLDKNVDLRKTKQLYNYFLEEYVNND
jgi:hypothetical protein